MNQDVVPTDDSLTVFAINYLIHPNFLKFVYFVKLLFISHIIKMISEQEIRAEWKKVKGKKLYRHYGPVVSCRWHNRFSKLGLLSPKKRRKEKSNYNWDNLLIRTVAPAAT